MSQKVNAENYLTQTEFIVKFSNNRHKVHIGHTRVFFDSCFKSRAYFDAVQHVVAISLCRKEGSALRCGSFHNAHTYCFQVCMTRQGSARFSKPAGFPDIGGHGSNSCPVINCDFELVCALLSSAAVGNFPMHSA